MMNRHHLLKKYLGNLITRN